MASISQLLIPKWKKRTHDTFLIHKEKYNNKEYSIAFLGDSIMEHLNDFYENELEDKGIANLSVGGDGIENLLYRLSQKSLEMIPTLKYIVILIGTNNMEKYTPLKIYEGILNLITIINEINPNVEITVLGLSPRFSKCKKYSNELLMTKINDINLYLSTIPEKISNANYYNLFKDFVQTEHYIDHVHFNREGYNLFWSRLLSVIQ